MIPLDCFSLYEDAQFYDEEFKDRVNDIPFYVSQSVAIGGPVLEVACGSGRLTVPIAQAGIEIVGVDVSAPMLERARLRVAETSLNVEWHLQDVRRLNLNRRFHLIFMAANALQHLHDLESILTFFDRMRVHLEQDGLLILDVFNPDIKKLSRTLGSAYLHKSFVLKDGIKISVKIDSEYLRESQILHFILTYSHEEKIIFVKDVHMRCFYPQELLALCQMGGFEVVQRLGNYDGFNFVQNSPKQILICRPKRGGTSRG